MTYKNELSINKLNIFFLAIYLGNQRNSYNQELAFKLKFTLGKSSMSRKDLVIENLNNGLQIYKSLYDTVALNNQANMYEPVEQEFTFKLKETDSWKPPLSAKDFQRLLSNLTSIKIKANTGDYTFLKSFRLKTAQKVSKPSEDQQQAAKWIEECSCPPSHTGQFCENCQSGFRREITFGDSFVKCIPCSCNNHSLTCDQSSGKCNCIHQTTGENCESCKEGYYGDALQGTPNDCKKCPCPDGGPCAEFYNHQSKTVEVVCLSCPLGTRGNLCDMCDDGFFESSRSASELVCEKCLCNSNIDENAVANCDHSTGQCLKCIYNTTGFQCDKCLPSYWGNALTDLKCHACECNSLGSDGSECDLDNGQCTCKKNVIGRQCDKCKDTFWNIDSNEGCQECKCNPLGATSLTCDQKTGACECRPGVTGLKCDQCLPNHFAFSAEGCKQCECDLFGSLNLQCNELGQCKCKENIAGDKCNQCAENFYNFTIGCKKCDDCYNLVQDAVNNLRNNIQKLEGSLEKLIPETVSEEASQKHKELQVKLENIKKEIENLHLNFYKQLKPTYKESLKSLEESIQNLNSDLKKLQKPFDSFELKLKELIPLDVKLNKSYSDIGLQITMVSIAEQQLRSQYSLYKEDQEREFEEEDNEDGQNENLRKLKNVARLARDTAEKHDNLAKNLTSNVNSYIAGSGKAINEVSELMLKYDRLQIESDIDYDILSKTSTSLAKDAEQVKVEMDQTAKKINLLKEKLDSFKLSEVDFEKEFKQSSEKLKEFNSIVIF